MVAWLFFIMLWNEDVPAVVRARPDFSGAIGRGILVSCQWSATSISLHDFTTFTVTLNSVRNPQDVKRPALSAIPVWQNAFQIEDGTTKIDADRVTFEYRCRPRMAGAINLPRLKLVSFNPGAAEGRQVQTTYAEIPPLTVTESVRQVKPIPFPDRLRSGLPQPQPALGYWSWLVVIPISLFGIVGLNWVRTIQVRRNRVWRLAEAKIQISNARHSPDPAATVLGILQANQIESKSLEKFCEQIRFAPNHAAINDLIAQAQRMVQA